MSRDIVPSNSMLEGTAIFGDISEKYEFLEVLGRGTFGTVRKCRNLHTQEVFAAKTVLKSNLPDPSILQREIEILSTVHHPHIIHLEDVYEDTNKIHLVMELCTGGELYDRVVEKTQAGRLFSEFDAAKIIHDILDAIIYCHEKVNVAHRDLKCENFMMLNEKDDSPVKIIDFGLSRKIKGKGLMSTKVGTVYYVAPEVLTDDGYSEKCDVWSIGIICYVLLCGYPPFCASNERETLNLVKKAEVKFPLPAWKNISGGAKRFVKLLLEKDPRIRPSASQAVKDAWLQQEQPQPTSFQKFIRLIRSGV